jgi:2,4-diaminopentanoate dehydrogenase
MTYRVIVWSTGNVGRKAIAGVVAHPELELVGVWTSTESKEGQDAGRLAGLDGDLGVTATRDVDALLALEPDVVVYTAMADNRLMEAVEDLARILRAGIDVVSSSPVFLQFPAGLPDDLVAPVRDACEAGAASLFVNGIDPGWANDALPLALTSICERIDELRCMEVVNYATYDNALVLFDVMGFGKPLDETPLLLMPGVLTLAWGSVVRQLAAGLGVELDEIHEVHERVEAPEEIAIASGTVAKGTMAGLRFEVQGMINGRPRIVLEHVTRLRDDLAPHWPQPTGAGGYRVVATGSPSYTLDMQMMGEDGDHNTAGLQATAMRLITAIPAVVGSPPGIVTALDLPPTTGRGLLNTAP